MAHLAPVLRCGDMDTFRTDTGPNMQVPRGTRRAGRGPRKRRTGSIWGMVAGEYAGMIGSATAMRLRAVAFFFSCPVVPTGQVLPPREPGPVPGKVTGIENISRVRGIHTVRTLRVVVRIGTGYHMLRGQGSWVGISHHGLLQARYPAVVRRNKAIVFQSRDLRGKRAPAQGQKST